nr:hypothetical protein CFP56_52824 [Quercus suber]
MDFKELRYRSLASCAAHDCAESMSQTCHGQLPVDGPPGEVDTIPGYHEFVLAIYSYMTAPMAFHCQATISCKSMM